jgi:hypothetical protein
MKVLIVSFAFPPSNVIGAIRVGKLARYLYRRGYELRVLTTDIVDDRSFPLEIPKEWIIYADYRERSDWLDRVARHLRRPATQAEPSGHEAGVQSRAGKRSHWELLRRQYYGLIHIPDRRAEWLKTAIPAGRQLIGEWRPDVIFASAPPYTGLIVASRLSRAFNIPWVADFRDLWVDNPYYGAPIWRLPVDAMLERSVLKSAAALTTVSPIWANQLRRRHGKIATVVYNGYAEEDFPAAPRNGDRGEPLTIRHTGSIYRGFRDPSPLFAAIALLSETLRNRVVVEFFGDASDDVLSLAATHGVGDRVIALPPVPYRHALELQMTADILLLLQWNDKRDEGNLPGKIFEYLYARRPILLIGYDQGVAAELITARGAGLVCAVPEGIRNQLQQWIEDKRAGRLLELDRSVSRGLSRDDQFHKIENIFARIWNERRLAIQAQEPVRR